MKISLIFIRDEKDPVLLSPQGQDLVRTSQLSVLEDPGQDRTVRPFAVLARTRRTGPVNPKKKQKMTKNFVSRYAIDKYSTW